MRKAIKAAFFGLISIAFVGSATADITFVSWGGAYTASQQKAYIDTLAKVLQLLLKTTTVVLEKSKHKWKQEM